MLKLLVLNLDPDARLVPKLVQLELLKALNTENKAEADHVVCEMIPIEACWTLLDQSVRCHAARSLTRSLVRWAGPRLLYILCLYAVPCKIIDVLFS